jgi:thiamine-phosphate diphosphorylase
LFGGAIVSGGSVANRLRLMCVTNHELVESRADGRSLADVVRAALAGGVTAVQLREKTVGAQRLADWAQQLWPACRRAGALLLINDRIDVAAAIEADGVHLGQSSLGPSTARSILGSSAVIGVSVHSMEELQQAVSSGAADYVVFGHIYPTQSKPGLAPRGVEQLQRTAAAAPVPVVGIGGISAANAGEVVSAGAAGVAVMSAIMQAAEPEERARELRRAVGVLA